MIRQLIYIFIIGAGLTACSSASYIVADADVIAVEGEVATNNTIDSLILPYRSELNKEMEAILCRSEYDFVKGRPNAPLNNWSADALLQFFKDSLSDSEPTMVLLNTGGLRSTINKGDVTLGDIYKLMPFDNEVVMVRLPIDRLEQIADYIKSSGGEPIAGVKYHNGKLLFNESTGSDSFWVITSDYLYNGGDNMSFFQDAENVKYIGVLLRDVFIEVAKAQKTLVYKDEIRIVLE